MRTDMQKLSVAFPNVPQTVHLSDHNREEGLRIIIQWYAGPLRALVHRMEMAIKIVETCTAHHILYSHYELDYTCIQVYNRCIWQVLKSF